MTGQDQGLLPVLRHAVHRVAAQQLHHADPAALLLQCGEAEDSPVWTTTPYSVVANR